MKPFSFLLLSLAALALFACTNSSSPEAKLPSLDSRVENFGLYDQNDAFHNLYYYSDASAIVLYVHGNGCPIVRTGMPALREVRDAFESKGVKFFMINANLQDNRESIAQEAADFGLDFSILVDEEQFVAEAIGIHRTAEAIVINPRNWRIVYRGPVDDRLHYETQKAAADHTYLADALTAHLTGEPIAEAVIQSPGCLVAVPYHEQVAPELTYTEDIAPLLLANCQTCHQDGGIAPWAMNSYEMIRGWAPMMREVLRTRRMPPWHADPHYSAFSNDISLTSEERQMIVHWVEMGAPKGEGEDILKEAPIQASVWKHGEPDVIIELETQEIPATGVLDYKYFEEKLPFTGDRWVKAVEFLPGSRAALHHGLVSVSYPEGFDGPMERRSRWFDGLFATYAPGSEPEVAPEGSGRYLPEGSSLVFQMHYTTTGKPETDKTRLGIFFAEEEPEEEFLISGPVNHQFVLLPEEKNNEVAAKQTFDEAITLYGMMPHMHFRGKSMSYEAVYPDGKREMLLNVPNYHFNWQRYYKLEEPRLLPAGSEIVVTAAFDNSSQNMYNPSPQDTVYWGEQSFEEMMIGYLSFVKAKSGEKTTKQMAARKEE